MALAWADIPVGVDVEQRRAMDWREAAFAFTAAEHGLIETSDAPLKCFYRLWTVREAFSKAVGIGLSVFEDGEAVMNYTRQTVFFQGKTLRFRTWEFTDYTLSLCAPDVQEATIRWLSAADWREMLLSVGCVEDSGWGDEAE